MPEFNPQKLHVHFDDKRNIKNLKFPRKYTLTHSDTTGDLFLSIGHDYDYKKFSSFYSRLLRDEVLGELQNVEQPRLDIHCHCSGGIVIGSAKWRYSIFRHHMTMVLKAICYGDRSFLIKNQDFQKAPIYVHFHTRKKTLDSLEKWGIISDFMPENSSNTETI
jgi:hypothetical protein